MCMSDLLKDLPPDQEESDDLQIIIDLWYKLSVEQRCELRKMVEQDAFLEKTLSERI